MNWNSNTLKFHHIRILMSEFNYVLEFQYMGILMSKIPLHTRILLHIKILLCIGIPISQTSITYHNSDM